MRRSISRIGRIGRIIEMEEKQPTFEDALAELEKIIGDLETGELTLDESLERYERGIKALNACRKVLGEAERKIQLLLRTSEGELKTQPFEEGKALEQPTGEPEKGIDEDEALPF